MFDRIFKQALHDAQISEEEFDSAISKAGFKNRADWFFQGAPMSLLQAYNERVEAEGKHT